MGLAVMALGLPMVLVPETAARIRYRRAADPHPTDAAVREARLGGVVIASVGLVVVVLS